MPNSADLNVSAGALQAPAFWSPTLNILFVVDGQVNSSKDPTSFGLGVCARDASRWRLVAAVERSGRAT